MVMATQLGSNISVGAWASNRINLMCEQKQDSNWRSYNLCPQEKNKTKYISSEIYACFGYYNALQIRIIIFWAAGSGCDFVNIWIRILIFQVTIRSRNTAKKWVFFLFSCLICRYFLLQRLSSSKVRIEEKYDKNK